MSLPYVDSLKAQAESVADPKYQMSFKRIMSLIAMAFLWTGSQIPIYIFGEPPCAKDETTACC